MLVKHTTPKRDGYVDRSGLLELAVEVKHLSGTSTGLKIMDFSQIVIDTMPEFGGGDAGPCPVELMLAYLAGCMIETAIYIVKRIRLVNVSSEARVIMVKKVKPTH